VNVPRGAVRLVHADRADEASTLGQDFSANQGPPRAAPETIWETITEPEWAAQNVHAPLVEYVVRFGGVFRAHANKGMKKFGCPDIVGGGEVIEVDAPRRLIRIYRLTMTPQMALEAIALLIRDIEPVRGGVT
jgi:hypothetical protein